MTLVLGACGGGKNDTDTDTAESTGTTGAASTNPTATDSMAATDTIGMSSAPTGDDASAGTASTEQSGSGSATDGGTTTDATASDSEVPTTGGADLMTLCQDFCQKNSECMESGPPDACTMDCVSEFEDLEEPCKATTEAFLACLGTMTCDELVAFADNDEPGPCAEQVDNQSEACADQACNASVGTNGEGTECAYNVSCPDAPKQEMHCDTETCTCLEGDKEVGSCPAEDACTDLSMLTDKAQACCGF